MPRNKSGNVGNIRDTPIEYEIRNIHLDVSASSQAESLLNTTIYRDEYANSCDLPLVLRNRLDYLATVPDAR